MNREALTNLLYAALETEQGGIRIYETALLAVKNKVLQKEWKEYLEQTRNHESILRGVLDKMSLDPGRETPGRLVVRRIAQALVEGIEMAMAGGDPAAAEVAAAESIVFAETKDHLNWQLLGEAAGQVGGPPGKALQKAFEEVEDEEDEHLYHTAGWCRELHLKQLGLPAVLPPPEEERKVKTAVEAARAKEARKEML
jgi:rubrerythrin